MNKTILFTSLAVMLALGLLCVPALRADESDYAPHCYDEDEAKEERSLLRPYLEPAHIPTPEYLASCKGVGGQEYKGDETLEQLKALSAKYQAVYDKIAAALPEKLSVPVARKRKILVLTYRTIGYYHTPGAAGCLIFLREAARKYGAFEITEVYKPDGIDAKMLAGFDVVVLDNIVFPFRLGKYGPQFGLYNTNPELRAEINSENAKEAAVYNPLYNELLPAYVKNGGGIVGVHGIAVMPIFSHQDLDKMEFAAMLGGAVDAQCHPWKNGKLSGPGGYCPIPIKILEPDNPLTFAFRDAPNAVLNTELYSLWLPKTSMDSSRTLIRYDYDKMPGVTFNPRSMERCKDFAPSIIWIKSYGKGRVFYNAIGHFEADFAVPCVARADLDGLLYATGDLKVPDAPATATTTRPTAN